MRAVSEKEVNVPWGTGFGFKKPNPNPNQKIRNYIEQQWQMAFSEWLHWRGIKHHASPNGEKRSPKSGAKLRALGLWAGFPDVFVPTMRGGYGALFIECKAEKTGKLQKNQLECHCYLREQGYKVEVCYSFEQAKQTVLLYLSS